MTACIVAFVGRGGLKHLEDFEDLENTDTSTLGVSIMMALISGALLLLSGTISLLLFCYQKIQKNSVVVVDQQGRSEYVRGEDAAAYYDRY